MKILAAEGKRQFPDGIDRLESLLANVQDLARNLAHLVAHLHRLLLVCRGDVVPGRIGVVLVAEGREALRDTDAGAVDPRGTGTDVTNKNDRYG